jgi:hypothetical protein
VVFEAVVEAVVEAVAQEASVDVVQAVEAFVAHIVVVAFVEAFVLVALPYLPVLQFLLAVAMKEVEDHQLILVLVERYAHRQLLQ